MKNVPEVSHNRFNGEHAEMIALRILNNDIRFQNKKLIMYVIAFNSSNNLSMSNTCILCQNKIINNNITTVYYSTKNCSIN